MFPEWLQYQFNLKKIFEKHLLKIQKKSFFAFILIGICSAKLIEIILRKFNEYCAKNGLETGLTMENQNSIEKKQKKLDLNLEVESNGGYLKNVYYNQNEDIINIIPESYTFSTKTYGCSHNVSDGEVINGLLCQEGFKLVKNLEDADIVILNTCTVKNPSQSSAVNSAIKFKKEGKIVIITGCVLQADSSIKELDGFSALGVKKLHKIVDCVFETIQGNIYRALDVHEQKSDLDLPKIRRNELIEIIPVSTGCLGDCSYCKTRFARGDLSSYPIVSILKQIDNAINSKCQQIWLTSEDTGAWGIDIGLNIIDLLKAIVNHLNELAKNKPVDIMIRFGMTNPPYILNNLEGIIEVFNSPYFFKFIHIPVQSGSDKILDLMKREYKREEFKKCADLILKSVPNLTLATDFICGFCGETEDDHKASLDLIKEYKFSIVNISQFYPRPGTRAMMMPKVNSIDVKRRSKSMTELFNSYETNSKYLNSIKKVWISETSHKSNDYVGHTIEYVKVLVSKKFDNVHIGSVIDCCIVDSCKWHLTGEPLN